MMARQILDHYIFKLISKKLFVWTIATFLLCFGQITPDHWMTLTVAYIGTQGFIDLALSWKNGVSSTVKSIASKVVEEVREHKEE